MLRGAAAAHLRYFDRSLFLTKSPFNSLRIPQLERHWGPAIRYLHIIRDQHQTADSLARNHFEFLHHGTLLTAEDAWGIFTNAVTTTAPADRLLTVTTANCSVILEGPSPRFRLGSALTRPHTRRVKVDLGMTYRTRLYVMLGHASTYQKSRGRPLLFDRLAGVDTLESERSSF